MAGILVVALALLGTIVAPGIASPPTVTWEDDTVTATFDGVPVDEAVAALARATGVEVRGELHELRDIHATFERARFPEVLDRLVGQQNFTITYDAAGRPRRVELLGMPEVSEPPAWRGSPGGFGNVVTAYGEVSLPPVLVARLLRIWFGPGTERFLGTLAEETHDALLRSKALRLEKQIRVGQPGADGPAT